MVACINDTDYRPQPGISLLLLPAPVVHATPVLYLKTRYGQQS